MFPSPPTCPPESAWSNAVLLVDKPKGWTSFDVCGRLRFAVAALLHRKPLSLKVGHAGTLGERVWRGGSEVALMERSQVAVPPSAVAFGSGGCRSNSTVG